MILHTLLFCLGFAQAAPDLTQTVEEFGSIKIGKPLPSFAGWTTRDQPWSFSRDRTRRPMLLSYFATWCEPCIKGIPIMEKVAKEENIDLILISIDEKESLVKRFLKKHGFKALTIVDTYKEIAKRHGVIQGDTTNSIPKTFLVDNKNIVRVIYTKEGSNFETLLLKNIQALKMPAKSIQKRTSPPLQPDP